MSHQLTMADVLSTAKKVRPLLPVQAVKSWLDCSEDDVLEMIQDGTLSIAFDLRYPGSERAFPRIYSECVLNHATGSPQPKDLAEAIDNTLPRLSETLRATTLASKLNTSGELVRRLAESGEWELISGPHHGPDGSAVVTRASVARWLASRRMS